VAKKKAKPPADPVLDALTVEAERLDDLTEGDEVSHALDEVIIDIMLAEASAINNGGYVMQLRHIVSYGAADVARRVLKDLAKELGAGEEGGNG
jgi:hypothetical protein